MESATPLVPFMVPMIIAALLLFLHRLLLTRNKGSSRSGRLPPGPPGLPVLGRLPFLPTDLHHCFADVSRSYGPVSSFWVGSKLFVVVSSPSAAMEVLKERDAVFANHAGTLVTDIVTKGRQDILWASYGPHWRMLRRVVMRELLNSTVLDSFRGLRRREVHRAVNRMRPNENTEIRDAVLSAAMGVILGMIWDGALRDGAGGLSGLADELREVIDAVVDLSGKPNVSDFLPALAPLDFQGVQRRIRAVTARYDAVMDAIMEQKQRSGGRIGGEGEGKDKKDFLQLLLELANGRDPEMPVQFDHIRSTILDLVTGGTDTTASTMEWAMTELVRTPEIMAKAQEELDAVVGEDGILEESHLPKLRYLDAVVKETFRIHPVAPFLVPHTPSTSSTIGGYTIPVGAWVYVNIWAIQRDPLLWERPLEFRPERFLQDEKGKWEYNGKSFDFLPFGRGRRICPAVNTGEKLVMHMLGTFLHSLNWQLPKEKTGVDVNEKFGIVLKKKEPLVLVPSIRRKQYFC